MNASTVALRPDPVVPQRDVLLDAGEVRRRLSTTLGVDGHVPITSCRATCVCYAAGKRLRVAYRIHVDGRDHHVAASTFRSRSRSERAHRRALESAHPDGSLRSVLHDADLDTVFWTFPNDRKIANLAAVIEPSPELAELLGGRWVASELVDYYPEATAVARCLDGSGNVLAYAKAYSGGQGSAAHEAHQAIVRAARGTDLKVPGVLGFSEPHQTMLFEPIRGRAVGLLSGAGLAEGLHAYGASLARLHSLSFERLPARRPPLERLHRKAQGVGVVRPDIATSSRELLAELDARWDEAADPSVLIHGDANANNAIYHDGRVALIDFDRAISGSAGTDVGNFMALLSYFRWLGVLTPAEEEERTSAFLNGYSSVRDLPSPSSVRVHVATALAERAFRAVNRVRPRALLLVPALIDEARGLLRSNGGER